jgi:hypothetical protein
MPAKWRAMLRLRQSSSMPVKWFIFCRESQCDHLPLQLIAQTSPQGVNKCSDSNELLMDLFQSEHDYYHFLRRQLQLNQ